MINLTQDQIDAIDFFADNEQYVINFGLSNLDREDRLVYCKGKKLIQSVLDKKNMNAKGHVRWTAEEYDAIAEAYHKHGRDRKAVLNEFRKYSERHSDDAVTLIAYSCAALDTTSDIQGLTDHADGLLNALNAITPNRFSSNR